MNKRLVVMLLVAVIMAVGASFVANNWLQQQLAGGKSEQEGMARVAAAAIDIPYGQKIELAHIKMVELPEKSIPQGAYTTAEETVGMIAAQTIISGEVVLDARIVEHLGGSTLAAILEPGMRAVAVKVNEIIGVAGFLLPGNRVDVLASTQGRDRATSVSTILRDIKVLAVDQTSSTDKNDPVVVRAVTLEVTPRQAEALVKATVVGKVQLALRNPKDDFPIAKTQKPDKKPAVEKPVNTTKYGPRVTMIRGTKVSTVEVSR